jgi:hypothetical protein
MTGISYKTPFPLLWAYDDAASGSFPQVDIPWFSFFLLAGAFFCCFTLLNGAIHRAGVVDVASTCRAAGGGGEGLACVIHLRLYFV